MSATKRKSYDISKWLVKSAYLLVKANAGAAGVDKETIEAFERDVENNLYRIWNRMSSGSYFPPAARAVSIPKKNGGERILGVPTVADRVAQTVARMVIEPSLERIFLPDSYGYRPNKSALDAVGIARERCWQYAWVLEFDIKGLFDRVSHELLLKAVRKHVREPWAALYIERWLQAPMEFADGARVERSRGTPRGGVVSPALANLFPRYAFDAWMGREYPDLPWCRYADDGLARCRTLAEAEAVKAALQKRLEECGLEMHPTKTKIVYCEDGSRKGNHPDKSFDFLGYAFRPRSVKSRERNKLFVSFTPAVSKAALRMTRRKIRELDIRNRTQRELKDIARQLHPLLRGWIGYYGRYCPSALYPLYRHVNMTWVAWARRKLKGLRRHKTRAGRWVEQFTRASPRLFVHWAQHTTGAFA